MQTLESENSTTETLDRLTEKVKDIGEQALQRGTETAQEALDTTRRWLAENQGWLWALAGLSAIGTLAYMLLRRQNGKMSLRATDILKSDHDKVKVLFDRFKQTTNTEMRDELAGDIIQELEIHSVVEEKIFYPATRQATHDDSLMDLALAEHQKANELIVEIQSRRANHQPFDDVMQQLEIAVRQHIEEEETEMMPEAERTAENLYALGAEILAMKQKLKLQFGAETVKEAVQAVVKP